HRGRTARSRGPHGRARRDARRRSGRCRGARLGRLAARPCLLVASWARRCRRRPLGVNLDRAIEDYLAYLHVERGLAAATIRAYRSDLSDFERSVSGSGDAWARSADPAVRYLAARTRRGEPGERALAPTSLRRRAAARKALCGFAFGEGIIDVDVATHLDLPRQSRRLPDTLDVDEVDRLLEAASVSGQRDRALLELLYAAGLRVSEAIGLDREDLSLDGAFVRVIGKGDKERLVPIGEVSIDHLSDWILGPRAVLIQAHHVAPVRGGPLFLGERGRRLARQQAWAA